MKWYIVNIDSAYLDKFMKIKFHDIIIKDTELIIKKVRKANEYNISSDITMIPLDTLKYVTNSTFIISLLRSISGPIPISITIEENMLISSLPETFKKLKEEVGEYFAAYKMVLFMKDMKIIWGEDIYGCYKWST